MLYAFLGNKPVIAQKFADKEFYLIDSLELADLTKTDKSLIDSLLKEYHKEPYDSVKLDQLTVLISNCENNIWIKYNDLLKHQSEQLIKSNGAKVYKRYLASAYNNSGYYFFQNDEPYKAIENFERAVKLSEQAEDLKVIPTALNNIGYIYKQQGNIVGALDNYHKSLKLNQKIGDEQEEALCLNNIGGIYYLEKEYDKALKYYRDALLLEKKSGTKKGEGRLYSNIGAIYKEQGKIDAAIQYFDYSIKIYQSIEYQRGLGLSLTKQAELELSLDKNKGNKPVIKEAIKKLHKAKEIFEEKEDNEGLVFTLFNLSEAYILIGNIEKANLYGQQSLIVSKKIGFPSSIKDASEVLQKISILKNDYKRAYLMQELFYKMNDSISSQSTKEAIIQKQYQYDYEKKVIRDSLIAQEAQKIKDLKHSQEIDTQKTYAISGGVAVCLMILVLIVIFRGYQIKKKSNSILEEKNYVIEQKNKEITDSITYAERIQTAIIPPANELAFYLKDSFVMYKPKDIVAGDFYWLQCVGDTVLYAVADCTGHGVPGAMVSVVCYNALNRAVREYKLTEPAKILDKTKEIVVETLKHSSSDSIILKDGMDIALCSINFKTNTLEYAGANNPLYIINPKRARAIDNSKNFGDDGQGYEIKADKQPVANHFKNESFTNHIVKLEKGDMIYAFTDGYPDQFGGVKGKKFMYKQFKQLLIESYDLPLVKQLELIDSRFNEWKGDIEQVDDVCVIGVKI